MAFNKKYITFLIRAGLIFLFFLTRLYNILALPIFTDEAIYIRWAQIAGTDAAQRFISLTDGKQPSFIWIAALILKFINDPLLAGRLVSVLAGFGSMIGIFFLTSEIFKNNPLDSVRQAQDKSLRARKIGLLASFIYVIYPFALIYDRLALYDSLVAMFIIWALYFEILLVRRIRLDLAMILGMIMGLGMLTKTSSNFAFILLPFSLLLFNFEDKKWKANLRNWIIYAFVSVIIAHAMYSILRLSPYFHIIGQKNTAFVYPLTEWISHPFAYLSDNLKGLGSWLIGYMTIPFLILVGSSILVGRHLREKLLLFVWFIAPFSALSLFGKVIYPRFILFMTMPLLVLGAYSLFHMVSSVKRIPIRALVLFVFLGTFVVNGFIIITNFEKAPIPTTDRGQFIAGWPSGAGVRETVEFLTEKSKNQKIYVGTEGTFGLMPHALEIYHHDNKNIEIKGFWPIKDAIPQDVTESANDVPTYFVFYQSCPSCPNIGLAPVTWPLRKVFQTEKLEKDSFYTLYQVIPNENSK